MMIDKHDNNDSNNDDNINITTTTNNNDNNDNNTSNNDHNYDNKGVGPVSLPKFSPADILPSCGRFGKGQMRYYYHY